MPEIRLAGGESMKNINLGSTEIQEVRLGQILVWRNNVPPFFTLSINGTAVSNNGTPAAPVDPVEPGDAPIQVFEYLNTITASIVNVQDEDLHYPIVFNLYAGDFDADDSLTPIGTAVSVTGATPGLAGSWNVQPDKVIPTYSGAASQIFTNNLYSMVGVDSEEGISIQYFRLTVNDSTDVKSFTPWVNSGGTITDPSSPILTTTTGLTTTYNTACYDADSTTDTFTRVSSQPTVLQPQVRTCSVTINGVQDTPALTCVGETVTQNVRRNNGSATNTDTVTATSTFPNTGHVVVGGVDATSTNSVGSPGPITLSSTVSTSDGACTPGALDGTGCAVTLAMCTRTDGSATRTTTTTPRTQNTNCAGEAIGSPINGTPTTSTSTVSCSYMYTNPDFVSPADISSANFSITGNNSVALLYNYGASFSSALDDDGNVGTLRRIVDGDISFTNLTTGATGSFSVSITAIEAGCNGSPGCGGLTSVSDSATNPISPLPSTGDVVQFTLTLGPGSYNTSDGGNVAGSGTNTQTHTWT